MPAVNNVKIHIKDAKSRRCPVCNTLFAYHNENEALYRNCSFLYINENKIKVKCKQCKNIIDI